MKLDNKIKIGVQESIIHNTTFPNIVKSVTLELGYLREMPVLIYVNKIDGLKVPTGNEVGAWQGYWIPGGYTNNGIPEAVVNQVESGNYTVTDIYK